MPGRAVAGSPGGTASILMPSEPNFICTGLATVALFFGSTKNTRGFVAAFPPDFAAWAWVMTTKPRHISATSSPSWVFTGMSELLSDHILYLTESAFGFRLSAFGFRLSAFGCRLSALGSRLSDRMTRGLLKNPTYNAEPAELAEHS